MIRRPALAIALALPVAAAGIAVSAMPAQALAKVKCDVGSVEVIVAQDDPIKVHDAPPGSAEHEHVYFGSTVPRGAANINTITNDDLRLGGTLCRDPADKSLYWMPTLRRKSTGELVRIQQGTFYYRSGSGANQGPAALPPEGLRLIASQYNYTCGTKSGARSAPVLEFPDCRGLSGKPGLTFTVHITFPSCLEDGYVPDHTGQTGDTQDSAHVRYPMKKACEAGFHPIPQLKETFQVAYTGDPADLVLSSDAPEGGSNGTSMHADWMNGWETPGFQTVIDSCITAAKQAPAKVCDR